MKTILVFAPHNDDEVIGVGGTIIKEVNRGNKVVVCEVTVTKGSRGDLIKSEAAEADRILGVSERIYLDLPVVALKDIPTIDLNREFCKVIQRVQPSDVFVPHYGDMHIDHRIVADAVMVASRPLEAPFIKRIYGYETLSETEWNVPNMNNAFIANIWNDISKELVLKIEAMKCYKTQMRAFPHPRSCEAIDALAKYRGSTIGVDAAESFMCIRQVL